MQTKRNFIIFSILLGWGFASFHNARAEDFCPKIYSWLLAKKERLSKFTTQLQNGARIYTARGINKLDAKSFAIFDRIRLHPLANPLELSEEDIKHLQAQGFWNLFLQYNQAAQIVKNINHSMALLYRSKPEAIQRSFMGGSLQTLKTIALPMLPDLAEKRARIIFEKFLHNQNLKISDLSKKEKIFLEKNGLKNDLERYIADLESYRSQFLTLTSIRNIRNGASWTVLSAASIAGTALSQVEHKNITLKDSLDPSHPDGMKKIGWDSEIIFSKSKEFPVLLKIGGSFWAFQASSGLPSLGYVDTLTKTPSGIRPITVETLAKDRYFSEKKHIRAQLNLSKEEIRNIRKALDQEAEKSTNNPYIQIEWQRSSEYRLAKFLQETIGITVPYGFNKSPEMILAYLKINKLLGTELAEKRIGEIRSASKNIPSTGDIALSASGNLLENYFFIQFLPVLMGTGVIADRMLPERAHNNNSN